MNCPRSSVVMLIAVAVAVSCDRSRAGSESSPPQAPPPFAASAQLEAPAPVAIPDTSSWFSAAQAPPPLELPREGRQCLSDTGCAQPPAALPPCPEGIRAETVDRILAAGSLLVGQVVVVHGKLSHWWGSVLLYDCWPQCCKRGSRTLALIPDDKLAAFPLVLNDPTRPGAFDCIGDESTSCCPVSPVPYQVIAVGRLRHDRAAPRKQWLLDDPRLCSLATRAPLPDLRATADGCELAGRSYGSDERVVANGVMCGCHAGTIHCRAESPGECFHAGQWHPDRSSIRQRRGSEMYSCQRGQWSRTQVIPTTDAYAVLTFARGSVELAEREASKLHPFVSPPEDGIPIDIRAWIDPAEGTKARQLARERAHRVQARLLASGFTKAQASISLHDVPPGAPVNDVGVTIHDAQ